MSTRNLDVTFESLQISPAAQQPAPLLSHSHKPTSQRLSTSKASFKQPIILGLPAFAAAAVWAITMAYFQIYLLNLPPEDDGSWPRIGLSYAAYPFISCIGAVQAWSFRISSIMVATLLTITFTMDFMIGKRVAFRGRIRVARIGKMLSALSSNAFLVALSFANAENGSQRDHHLIFVSLQIFGMGMVRSWDWLLIREMIRWPALAGDPALLKSRRFKKIESAFAFPASMVAMTAIYSCTATPRVVEGEPQFSMQCWSLLSYSAVFEWTLSWVSVGYMCTLGFDLMNLQHWAVLMGLGKPELARKYFPSWITSLSRCARKRRTKTTFNQQLEL